MAVHSKGTTLKVKIDTAYVEVPGIPQLPVPAGQRAKIDTTTLSSARKEHILDIADSFDMSFELFLEPGETGGYHAAQQALEDAYYSGDELDFQVVMPPAFNRSYSFKATVSLFQPNGAVGDATKASVTISSTGDVAKGTAA